MCVFAARLRMRSESVESCEKWANSTTQQVDLAFNVFFMIYFFIRVTRHSLTHSITSPLHHAISGGFAAERRAGGRLEDRCERANSQYACSVVAKAHGL